MSDKFQCRETVELQHELEAAAMLSKTHPVPSYLEKPLKFTVPAGAHGVVEKNRKGEAYLVFPASDDIEVKRWVQHRYLKKLQ